MVVKVVYRALDLQGRESTSILRVICQLLVRDDIGSVGFQE